MVGMPIAPRYTWGQSKWPVYFWRSVGVIILVLLVPANLPHQPVTFTAELPFEVVQQMEEASETCRDARESGESSCAAEVWRSCHLASQTMDNFKGSPSLGGVRAMMYLCDLAVIADAGELASALATRYGDSYGKIEEYVNYVALPKDAPFILFHDLVNLEFYFLSSDRTSQKTREKQNKLKRNVAYFFGTFRNGGSSASNSSEIVTPSHGRNPWRELSAETSEIPARVMLLCDESRMAIREYIFNYQSKLDSCLQAAEICEHASEAYSLACSLEAGAAEFERMWQQLPEVCASAGALDDSVEEDACQEAALILCDYKLVSPGDEWVGQLISMRDFACAAAGKLPGPQVFCSDNPTSFLCDPNLTDQLEMKDRSRPYMIAFDDSELTKVGRRMRIDVLNNDIYADNPFFHPRISLLEFPEMGIAEITYDSDSYPYITYTPYTPGQDTLSYTICYWFRRCDTAQVRITVTTPPCSITGTQERDVLLGTPRDDVICGLRGNDVIDGRSGNDIIRGGDGDDILRGNLGSDIIYPGPGNNIVVLDETEKDTIIREADDNTVTHIHPDDD